MDLLVFPHAPRPLTHRQADRVRSGIQMAARRLLRSARLPFIERRLRQRLGRWTIPCLPGRRPRRAMAVLRELEKRVPPRVRAAIVRTWLNGWCTQRRFQSCGSCRWGCLHGADSIEHYSQCRVLEGLFSRRLRLPALADPAARSERFLLLHGARGDELVRCSLWLAAVYRAHNEARVTGIDFAENECARRALEQALREQVRGHARATATLHTLWSRP